MKARCTIRTLVATVLVAAALPAADAQAQVIHPNDSAFSLLSGNSTFSYGSATYACDTATADGTTGNEQSFIDLALTFTDNCNISGLGVRITCSELDPYTGVGGARLTALDAGTDRGTVDLNEGFFCDATIPGVCTLSVDGPQNPNNAASSADLNNGADTLQVDMKVAVTRTGSTLCGPPNGTGNLSATYDVLTPDEPEID